MKKLLLRSTVKIILTITLISIAIYLINLPTLTNQIAMLQLENDNGTYIANDLFTKIKPIIEIATGFISILTIGSIGHDIYKFKKKKEEK